jgi:hypothetical protein
MTTERSDWNFETPTKEAPASFPAEPAKGESLIVDMDRGVVRRDNWGAPRVDDSRATGVLDNGGGRETPGSSPAPKPTEAPRTTTDAPDKAAASKGDAAADDPLASLDPADVAAWRQQLATGIWTPEELGRHYGLSASELEAIQGAAKAEPAAPEGLDEIEAELAKIDALRRSDRRAYDKNAELQEKERELLQARTDLQNFAQGEALVQATVDTTLSAMPNTRDFEASFLKTHDDLTDKGKAALSEAMRVPMLEPARLLPESKLSDYAALGPETAKQVATWGKDALRLYTRANARLNAVIDRMPEADAAKAVAYLRKLSPAEKAAVIAGLAR